MAFVDQSLEFTTAGGQGLGTNTPGQPQLVTISTNIIDLSVRRDIVDAEHPLEIELRVTEAFTTAAGAPRLRVGVTFMDVNSNDAATILASGNPTTPITTGGPGLLHYTGPTLLTLNSVFWLPVPRTNLQTSALSGYTAGMPSYVQRYMCVSFWQDLALTPTNTFATGKISAKLITQPRNLLKYPAAKV